VCDEGQVSERAASCTHNLHQKERPTLVFKSDMHANLGKFSNCGQGGCTGAMVGTTCASKVIYMAERPPYLHSTKCHWLPRTRCGRVSMAFQSSPSTLTLPGLSFTEGSMDWGAVCWRLWDLQRAFRRFKVGSK
jgi:hypothetical protein